MVISRSLELLTPKFPILNAVDLKLNLAVGSRLIQNGNVTELDMLDKSLAPNPNIYVQVDDAKMLNEFGPTTLNLFVILLYDMLYPAGVSRLNISIKLLTL
jgi:hypothetical protein